MTDVQLPDMIDPEATHVEFRVSQCEQCQEAGPLTLVNNPDWMLWGDAHADATGHKRFYQYTVTRNRGQITTVGALRSKRRPLGNRGA